jgi:glycosyltransferase involved in cell wall biosynthesis
MPPASIVLHRVCAESLMKKLYVHPAIRDYREPLFRRLGEAGFHFLFTYINPINTHAGKSTRQILASFPYRFYQARELKKLPVSNFSLDLLQVFRYQVVVFSSLTSIPFMLLALPLRILGKKILLFDETWRYQNEVKSYRLMRPWIAFLVKRCVGAFIPAGTKAKEMFQQEFGVASDRLFPAYNTTVDLQSIPSNSEQQANIRARVQEAANGRTTILYLARIVRYKALDVLIHAMTQIPEDACLIVVGNGPFQAECEELVGRLGLEKRVHFLGPCLTEESPYFYQASDVFVLPTRFLLSEAVNCESWGFTINEAMSLEIPVVATTAVGAAYDLIEDGKTGMMAEENNPDSLAEKIRFLLADPARRREIGRQGRVRLLERCSYTQNEAAYRDAVRRVTQTS